MTDDEQQSSTEAGLQCHIHFYGKKLLKWLKAKIKMFAVFFFLKTWNLKLNNGTMAMKLKGQPLVRKYTYVLMSILHEIVTVALFYK